MISKSFPVDFFIPVMIGNIYIKDDNLLIADIISQNCFYPMLIDQLSFTLPIILVPDGGNSSRSSCSFAYASFVIFILSNDLVDF